MTPYQYAANNPVNFIDVNGDSIYVYFTNDEARSCFENIINTGLGGFYNVTIDDDGLISLTATGKDGEMSELQKNFYGELSTLNKAAKFEIVADNDNGMIQVGSYELGGIDVADMSKGLNEIITPQSMLIHELAEQKAKQIDKEKYREAHKKGIEAEDKVSGAVRVQQLPTSNMDILSLYQPGHVDILFRKENINYRVIMNFNKGNVSSINVAPEKTNNASKK